MENERTMVAAKEQELKRLFPLFKDLLAFAESKGLSEGSISDYAGDNGKIHSRAIELPEKFRSFTQGDPKPYFIVACENRGSSYYKQGTRTKLVRLSTVRTRSQSDERVREVDVTEMDPSAGNKLQIKITESVNNKEFLQTNTAQGDEVDMPHGQARVTSEMDSNGKTQEKTLEFSRFDEGIFPWDGETKPVRWIRNLTIEKDASGVSQITYRDQFNVDRWQPGNPDKRAIIETKIRGSLENPEAIVIRIGFGGTRIFHDPESRLEIFMADPVTGSVKIIEYELAILKRDPSYATLFADKPNAAEIVKNVVTRIKMLKNDWGKLQSIYTESATDLNETPKVLEK